MPILVFSPGANFGHHPLSLIVGSSRSQGAVLILQSPHRDNIVNYLKDFMWYSNNMETYCATTTGKRIA